MWNSGIMLSLSEDLLFVWELALKCHGMHLVSLNGSGGGGKNFNKKSCGKSENFHFEEGLYYGVDSFFKGKLQGIFGENRKLHNCSTVN